MAEALLRHHAVLAGVEVDVDSAGIGDWHAGEPPDHRMRSTAKQFGVLLEGQARQINKSDFKRFELILCSDAEILDQVLALGADSNRTSLMLDYHPDRAGEDVPDPYYGEHDGFKTVFRMLDETCRSLIQDMQAKRS